MDLLLEQRRRELLPDQREAAHTIDRHVAVTAGPGAGKTTVLVERYLQILRRQQVSVDQVVAITFTNRAANEMRERLRRELDNLLKSAGPDERPRWMHHKRTLDGAIITTIHGFCSRLLREFPLEADLDPQFILLEAHQSTMLEESVAEEVITRFISDENKVISELASGAGRMRLSRGLIDIYRSARGQGLEIEELRRLTDRTHLSVEDYIGALDELNRRIIEFVESPAATPAAHDKQLRARKLWPRLLDLLRSAPEPDSTGDVAAAIDQFRELARPNASGRLSGLVKILDELIWNKGLRGRVPQILLDLNARLFSDEVLNILAVIEKRLDEEKRRRSALDFDDLQIRALRLLNHHSHVLRRIASRYRFFLVDEFQDTNALQRDLMLTLAFGDNPDRNANSIERSEQGSGTGSNLFVVGDRKQSIYGFRGADVDVFREMSARIEEKGGLALSLARNFRSQRNLISFLNCLFERVFRIDATPAASELNELGYVEHQQSIAARTEEDEPPLVEVVLDLRPDEKSDAPWVKEKPRERDAAQLARRIMSMVSCETISSRKGVVRSLEYRDFAMLFRAMTEVHIYESALRRAGIPYVTVEGRGFYAREEVVDFIQLLRFLDNSTDEVALAAVLRSPICGLSDDALFALRCAPLRTDSAEQQSLDNKSRVRPLLDAVRVHQNIDFIDDSERIVLDFAREFLDQMIRASKRSRVANLLRLAIDATEYRTAAAANYDGAQRLANLEKLVTLADRYEKTGAYNIRDFVRFVRDFEESGGRESEGQIDETANAVRLMSIHQSKGLEFPVVIIPDLHRLPDNRSEWWALDRHRGLTVKVPDGRGRLVGGLTFSTFVERAKRREHFEGMRLLYVAATRAEDRLILSGAAKDLVSLRNSWLDSVTKSLGINIEPASGVITPVEGVQLRLTLNLLDRPEEERQVSIEEHQTEVVQAFEDPALPLLEPIQIKDAPSLHRFSVTQLLNYRRCPRQYYFDRVLYAPDDEELSVWNDAEAPEPPSNLTATIRGAVIHRFCEKYRDGDDTRDLLSSSFDAVMAKRTAELAERVVEIDRDKALRELEPLAENYVRSNVRKRIEAARDFDTPQSSGKLALGVLSEQRFRLRRPLGILSGTIDKLLVRSSPHSEMVDVEIIDFKTNRFPRGSRSSESIAADLRPAGTKAQLSFGFLEDHSPTDPKADLLVRADVASASRDYEIQMQAYALAAHELIPNASRILVTLHFVDPDVEVSLSNDLLDREHCAQAIDETMQMIVEPSMPESFPVQPAQHCRACSFLDLCVAGRSYLASTTN